MPWSNWTRASEEGVSVISSFQQGESSGLFRVVDSEIGFDSTTRGLGISCLHCIQLVDPCSSSMVSSSLPFISTVAIYYLVWNEFCHSLAGGHVWATEHILASTPSWRIFVGLSCQLVRFSRRLLWHSALMKSWSSTLRPCHSKMAAFVIYQLINLFLVVFDCYGKALPTIANCALYTCFSYVVITITVLVCPWTLPECWLGICQIRKCYRLVYRWNCIFIVGLINPLSFSCLTRPPIWPKRPAISPATDISHCYLR